MLFNLSGKQWKSILNRKEKDMAGEVKNAIIMELLKGYDDTGLICANTGASERHVQRVRNEFYTSEEIYINPICDGCGVSWVEDVNEGLLKLSRDFINDTFDTKVVWKDDFVKVLDFYHWTLDNRKNWALDNIIFFLCSECSLKELMKEEEKRIEEKTKEIERGMQMTDKPKKQEDFGSDEYFEVDLPEEVKTCGKCKAEIPVWISNSAKQKMKLFMKWSGRCEWLAYLVGKFENDIATVEDLYIPNQSASSALVNNVTSDEYNSRPIIGVIHSHHDMGGAADEHKPGFSGHDEAFINSNHNISLLIAKDGISGLVRVKTECGAYIRVPAKIKLIEDYEFDIDGLKEEFQSKVNNGRWNKGKRGKNWSGIRHGQVVVTNGNGEIIDLNSGYNFNG